jgi:hypothetical protein
MRLPESDASLLLFHEMINQNGGIVGACGRTAPMRKRPEGELRRSGNARI